MHCNKGHRHSITDTSVGGTVRPSAPAVLRSMTRAVQREGFERGQLAIVPHHVIVDDFDPW